jgi:hypothetical protein
MRASFENREYCVLPPRERFLSEVTPNTGPAQDYTPVFLSHACLYVLADKYGIEPLSSLVLHKLHETLMSFTLYSVRTNDIIDLIRYIYSNTHDYGDERLRVLVLEYVASEVDVIGKSEAFHTLLAEGGAFVQDFWKIVQDNLL